jgi:deoxycytidylate deaminase
MGGMMHTTPQYQIAKTKVFNGIEYTLYAIKYLDKDECKEEAKWIREQGIKARIVYEMPKCCIYFVKEEIDMLASWFEIPDNPIGAAIMRPLNVVAKPPQRHRSQQARPASERTLKDFF